MTEKLIRNEKEAIDCLRKNKPTSGYYMLQESVEMAIQALEEIQQYRAIGTIEELKAIKQWKEDTVESFSKYDVNSVDELMKRFKELTEKAEPKKPTNEIIPRGTKIIYHGSNGWEDCKCYCGRYNEDDDTYNIYNGWNLCHVPKSYIEVLDWD